MGPKPNKGQSDYLGNVVSIYVARRELVFVLQRELLHGESEIKLEDAEVLLGLFRAKIGEYPAILPEGKGFAGLKQIETTQMLSQSQIHRRVTGLTDAKYLEEKLPRQNTAAVKVRLTERGVAFAEQFWEEYKKFGLRVLGGIDASERRAHLRVNDAIQRKIHGLSLPWSTPSQKAEPVENLISVFATAKAIRRAIEGAVIRLEDGFSVERADLLVYLYIKGGQFVSFGQIQRNLVHSFSASRNLISRWISILGPDEKGFVETRLRDGKRVEAAITQKGCDVVEPIFDRYRNLARNLLADISEEDRRAHLHVNRTISDSIRPKLEDLGSAVG